MKTTDFLGYVVTPNCISMDKAKTKAINDWPEPRKVHDIQSFLGFSNFYHHFIHNYSDIVIPLTQLTRKTSNGNLMRAARHPSTTSRPQSLRPLALFTGNPTNRSSLKLTLATMR